MARNTTALSNRNAMMAARTAARYSGESYTPIAIESLTNRQISRELSQARDILRKRASRAGEFYTADQQRRIERLLEPVRNIPIEERPERLAEIARELAGGHSSLTQARERLSEAVEGFQQAGYDFVNSSNVREFLEFAQEFTWKERDKSYGSGTLLRYFEHQKERIARGDAVKVSRRSFLLWLHDQER